MLLTKNQKKTLKRIMKRLERPTYEDDKRILLKRVEEDCGYGIEDVRLLVAAANEKEVEAACKDYPIHGVDISPSAYDCTGQFFCDPADIRRVAPNRYLVTINGRYDV